MACDSIGAGDMTVVLDAMKFLCVCWVFGGAKHDLASVIFLDATLPIKTVGSSDRHYRMDFDPVVNGSLCSVPHNPLAACLSQRCHRSEVSLPSPPSVKAEDEGDWFCWGDVWETVVSVRSLRMRFGGKGHFPSFFPSLFSASSSSLNCRRHKQGRRSVPRPIAEHKEAPDG